MSTPAVLPHVDAVQAALEGAGLAVYLGGAPAAPPDMYAVLYPDPGRASSASLAGERTEFSHIVQVTCVGATAEQALWVADKVRSSLDGPLTVAGRRAWQPEDQGGPPVARDDDLTPPVFFVPVQYLIQSIPS